MTNVVIQKSAKCIIEWTVETSNKTDTFVSETFLLLYRKCNLKLVLGHYNGLSFGRSYLYLDCCKEMKSPINVSVRVVNASDISNDQAGANKSITTTNTSIWSSSNGSRLRNVLLTFEVIIYADTSTVDKSIQTPSYIDKGSLLDDIARDFSKLFDDVNHDVEFTCGEQTIKAHKNVLCCRSNVFASMLQTDMVEGQTGRVNIVDMDADIFQQLVKCLYTGILPKLTLPTALQFYNAGDKYNIGALRKQCAEFLIDNLSPENACDILIVADRHSDVDFKKSIIEYMTEEKIPYMGGKWTDFCKENPVLATEVLNLFCQHLRPK